MEDEEMMGIDIGAKVDRLGDKCVDVGEDNDVVMSII